MANSIVRIEFSLPKDAMTLYIDHPFDQEKSNQENCDVAVAYLVNAMQDKRVLAVSDVAGGIKVTPALLNLDNITCLLIQSAKVYELKNKDTEDTVSE